ncbi:hypothetical protein GCM10011360_01810 [Primorskyibacter flagellatus]|uniref:Uncharacterized protein n=1 Tax=Primorskyibacter flagellatus TaxID=1387277 RepID=A0A917E9P6_9RHOB|nr:hypothetical protein [Primorskyibacter flagellatus]GGE16674.1 hypothetical protein GCM10011360_01810 [Primorskyibacter flagellatus]
MSDIKIMPKDKLRALIGDTEETLAELKAEMERRDEADQAREIENLEEHMKNAELSLQTIRDFFRHLVEDMKSRG